MAFRRFRSRRGHATCAQENVECRNRIDVVRRERLQLIQASDGPIRGNHLRFIKHPLRNKKKITKKR